LLCGEKGMGKPFKGGGAFRFVTPKAIGGGVGIAPRK